MQPARDVETVEENFQQFLEEQQERREDAQRQEVLREDSVTVGETSDALEDTEAEEGVLPFEAPQLDATAAVQSRLDAPRTRSSLNISPRSATQPSVVVSDRERTLTSTRERTDSRTGTTPTTRDDTTTGDTTTQTPTRQLQPQRTKTTAATNPLTVNPTAPDLGERTATRTLEERSTAIGVAAPGLGLGRRLPRPEGDTSGDSDDDRLRLFSQRRSDLVDFRGPLTGEVIETTGSPLDGGTDA